MHNSDFRPRNTPGNREHAIVLVQMSRISVSFFFFFCGSYLPMLSGSLSKTPTTSYNFAFSRNVTCERYMRWLPSNAYVRSEFWTRIKRGKNERESSVVTESAKR